MNSKTKQNLIFLLTFVALVAAAANNVAWAQSPQWAVEVVDSEGDNFDNVLAYDPAGNPAIAYRENTNGQLKFAHWNGFSWDIEIIGAVSGETDISLAYDGDQPTVSYTNGGLYIARYSISGWVSELVDGSNDILNRPVSLAYDNNGNPAISYRAGKKEEQTVLKFAYWNGASWDIEIVIDAPSINYISLVYDSDGKPAIAFMNKVGRNLRTRTYFVNMARWNDISASWDIETVDTDSFPGIVFFLDLDFDATGLPSLVYCKTAELTVYFAHYNGASWDFEWVGNGIAPSLAYHGDTAFVSYSDLEGSRLQVAKRNAMNNWETETVDGESTASYLSIAIDPAGNPAISYEAGGNHNLKFARRDPSNECPTVNITSPANDSTFPSGDTVLIVFTGTAIDTEDGDLAAYLTWTSNIMDDPIGFGGSFSTTLLAGSHVITASVTDSGGKTGSASVNITVGEQPTIHIEDIAMNSGKAGPNYYALATVWIIDDVGVDVEGATVYGQWSDAVSGTATGVTDSDGKVTLQSPKKKKGGTFTFTVTDVVASGYIYDEGLNAETEDSITVP